MQAAQRTVTYDLSTGAIHKEEKMLPAIRESELNHAQESNIVGIYPNYLFQKIDGFGCALTESACCLLSRMDADRIKAVTINDTHTPFFSGVPQPEQADLDGFNAYFKQFRALLDVVRTAVAVI